MEHACHNCGATVQEGRAFCPNCNAPQIRVNTPEPVSPSFEPGTPGEMQPPAQPVPLRGAPPLSPTAIDWSTGGRPVVVAGLISGIAFFLPLNLVWVVGAGVLAVWMYSRRRPPYMQISAGTGAKLGAVTGLVGFILFAGIAAIGMIYAREKIWAQFTEAIQQRAAANPDVNVQQLYDIMKTSEGRTFIAVFVMIFALALFLGLSTLGGAIGAALVRRDQRLH